THRGPAFWRAAAVPTEAVCSRVTPGRTTRIQIFLTRESGSSDPHLIASFRIPLGHFDDEGGVTTCLERPLSPNPERLRDQASENPLSRRFQRNLRVGATRSVLPR